MKYPGRAYEEAKVMPGDEAYITHEKNYYKVKIIDPSIAKGIRAGGFPLSGDPNRFVYYEVIEQFWSRPSGYIGGIVCGGIYLHKGDKQDIKPQTPVNLKQQNDAGGSNGKCVQCNGELKAWMLNRFYCPVCEP